MFGATESLIVFQLTPAKNGWALIYSTPLVPSLYFSSFINFLTNPVSTLSNRWLEVKAAYPLGYARPFSNSGCSTRSFESPKRRTEDIPPTSRKGLLPVTTNPQSQYIRLGYSIFTFRLDFRGNIVGSPYSRICQLSFAQGACAVSTLRLIIDI